jgi:hypothetical protein
MSLRVQFLSDDYSLDTVKMLFDDVQPAGFSRALASRR